jgi:hypothetical protein
MSAFYVSAASLNVFGCDVRAATRTVSFYDVSSTNLTVSVFYVYAATLTVSDCDLRAAH